MKKIITLILLFGLFMFSGRSIAQITVTSGVTAAQVITTIVGPTITTAFVSETRQAKTATKQVGTYTAAAAYQIPIKNGVILTCGDVTLIPGGNSSGSDSDRGLLSAATPSTDADLSALTTQSINDMYRLEFDVISVNFDTLVVNYIFGSEEYLEFVGSFNDVFGFFIKGNEYPTYKNFAVVPGTANTSVTINNINSTVNSAYFVNNSTTSANVNKCEYDGFTTVLKAKVKVTRGLTYRLKFAIADASDGAYDSGVFIEANTITNNSVTLPVSLANFTSELDRVNRKTILQWNTMSEKNNNLFEIQRSMDGITFSTIGTVKGNGNSNVVRSYKYTDDSPSNGMNYYRLRQVDFDGQFAFSDVRAINFINKIITGKATPNPITGGTLSVSLDVPVRSSIEAQIIDLAGKIIYTEPIQLNEGINTITINTEFLQTGCYFLRFMDQENNYVSDMQKIVK